jgi:hypothetical protein
MHRPTAVMMWLALPLLLALAGCPPTETPGYSPDGGRIALVALDPTAQDNAVWIYDVQRHEARAHHVAAGWNVINARWIGPQLWVECTRPVEGKKPATPEKVLAGAEQPTALDEHLLCPFDLDRDDFVSGAPHILRQSTFGEIKWAVGSDRGQMALFVDSDDADHHEIYTLPDLHKTAAEGPLELLPAGRGWCVREVNDDRGAYKDLREVIVLNPEGKESCRIHADAIAPACHGHARHVLAARMAEDQSTVALAFGTETIFRNHPRKYTFGVFAVNSGALMWAGGSDSMEGVPLVKHDEVWTIEFVDRRVYTGEKPVNLGGGEAPDPPKDRFALVRHRPGKSPSQFDGQREVVLTYQLGNRLAVTNFAPSPDGSQILLTADGPHPRLLFVPIGPAVEAKDVKVVELK